MEEKVKQLIIVRKDLDMPVGKLSAQVSHASLLSFLNACNKQKNKNSIHYVINDNDFNYEWINGSYPKVVLAVKNENQILKYKQKAEENGIPCALITDEGRTCFDGQPTITCLGVGPFDKDILDKIFKRLRLY